MRNIHVRDDEIRAAFELPDEPVQTRVREVAVARQQDEMRPIMIDHQA